MNRARTILIAAFFLCSQICAANAQGRLGVSAGAQAFSGNLHNSSVSASLSVHYETPGAMESLGFRYEGHLNAMGGILGGGLFGGVEYLISGQQNGFHLSAFGGAEVDLHVLTFDTDCDYCKTPVRFVLDPGARVGLQFGYGGNED
jgi:hypothetical protein